MQCRTVPLSTFSGTVRFFPFCRLCEAFFENFSMPSKGPLELFLIFCNRMDVKKYQSVDFRFFGTMRLFKILILSYSRFSQYIFTNNIFRFNPTFPRPHYSGTMRLSPICFLQTKSFASIEDSLRFLALGDLPKTFFTIFLFFDGSLLFPFGWKVGFESHAYPLGRFRLVSFTSKLNWTENLSRAIVCYFRSYFVTWQGNFLVSQRFTKILP